MNIAYFYGDTNWKDKLTAYNGKAISYDAIGNPLTYDGLTYTWENGRPLKSLGNGTTSLTFKYDDAGIRTEKTINGVTTKYTLFGDKVSFETTGSDKIHYRYDASGNIFSMNLNGSEYYYTRNAQGDITGLIDGAKNQVVSYTYDTWGKLISTTGSLAGTLGLKNPYRYRGYRYDTETGLYYLQSRYYNPDWGRFVNADDSGILEVDQDSLIENNLFVYALNNPVNMIDPAGYIAANIIGGVVGGASGALLGVMLAKHLGLTGLEKWALISAATVGGAVLGAFLGPYVAKLVKVVGSAVKTGASSFKATIKAATTAIKHSRQVTNLINNASKLKRSATVMKNVASRPYINSTQTIQNIMRAGKPIADASLKNGLKWVVDGAYNGTPGKYELVIDVATNTIVHFLFRGSK